MGNMNLQVSNDHAWNLYPMVQDSFNLPQKFPAFWDIGFADSRTGWAVGQYGARITTTDGGRNWRFQKIDASVDSFLTAINVFDGLTTRATGYLGRSVLTSDGGSTWVGEETGTKAWLLASSFLSPTLGWVGGENGMVLKYGRLPYGAEEERGKPMIPWMTSLAQNRPNPFTIETEIRYQLAAKGKVSLTVYNVLGQAVKRVVDQEQDAGAYTVAWDGKDKSGRTVASGVYFYRLEAGAVSQTKKMVKVR
jgi:hypothetical protein